MSIEIRAISFQEVVSYISSEAWEEVEVIPISMARALSQQKNPLALPEEPCIWVATDPHNRVVGFAGSLPGSCQALPEKMGWNTCWWVDPVRGKEAAMQLLLRFLEHWGQKVAFADMTSRTHSIIEQLRFCNTREEKLVQSYMRVPGSKIVSRFGIAGVLLYPVVMAVVFIINLGLQVRLRKFFGTIPDVKIETREELDENVYEFIIQHSAHDFTRRSMDEFQWIITHPWLVKETPQSRKTGKKYPFSYHMKHHYLEWIVLRQEGKIISVMLVSCRDGVLKVLYYFGVYPEHGLNAILQKVAREKGIYSLIFAHPKLVNQAGLMGPVSLKTRFRPRFVGISKKIMASIPPDLVIQLGDGDSSFT